MSEGCLNNGVWGPRPQGPWDFLILPAQPEDVDRLAPRMREIDRREVWASHRHTPLEALRSSLECSVRAWTAEWRGEVAAMFGVSNLGSLLGFIGCPWLLGSDMLERPEVARGLFVRQMPHYNWRMGRGFLRLENFVHAENRKAIRWLSWLGYKIAQEPARINGEEFYLFWRDC